MDSTTYIHPAPKIARQIQRLLWISIVLSFITLAFSMVTLGIFSLWITPATTAFSVAHNVTLLSLSFKERKRTAEERSGKLPATATKASIICSFVLAFLWTGAMATVILFCAIYWTDREDFSLNVIYVAMFESVFALFEVIAMITLGIKCRSERQHYHGITAGSDGSSPSKLG